MPIGKIEPFDLTSKQWPAYVRRVNQFIILNEIKSELKVSLLITVVGEATYALMCDLCAPEKPEAKTYNELVQLVTDHLEPQRSEIAERHVFRQRRQRPGETLTEYLQHLKHLAATCNFGSRLEEDLRDQFVSGLASDIMRSRIFAEKNLNYNKAVELALALEAAERHAEVSGAAAAAASASGAAPEGLHAVRGGRPRRAPAGGGGGGAPRTPGAAPGARACGRFGGGAAQARDDSVCWRCGKSHRANKCRFVNYNCDKCNQRGHLKVMCEKVHNCESASYGFERRRQNYLSENSEDEFYNLNVSSLQGNNKPYFIELSVDSKNISCEIDTGSRISAINEQCYEHFFKNKELLPDNLVLRSYSGSRIEPLGYILVNVSYNGVNAQNLQLYIIRGGGKPLLGRDWLRALKITQININEINEDPFVSQLCREFPEVFCDKLGTCKKAIRLQLADEAGVYVRARPVPLALRGRVERELERLERDGTIYRVEHSEFGTPIVPVIKSNGEVRICGDYKITINPKLKRDFYPLPRIEELFATLSNGEEYTKIDLKHAYEQVLLSEESQRFTAITTHVGTFAYRRTPYGLSCVPEQFQKLMEETLRGIPGTVVFLDDIAVTGEDRASHLRNLRAVLERLRQMGLTVKLSKCKFLQRSVNYLGFIINKEGLHPDPAKLEAITSIPRPTDVTQLRSFLGFLNYYGKFIPNLSVILHPLHSLLKKGVAWNWDSHCERAFIEAKKALVSDRVLAHYEDGRPLVLAVDSSAYGVGAVLAHRFPDGRERPVSCASRTLNDAERNYSQLDKEALAIYFGITKHHQYLFGRQFILRTDHKPLTYIFGDKRGIPQTAASRLQRWAVCLAGYDFKIEFVRSADNAPADSLSRLPLTSERPAVPAICYLNYVEETMPIDFKDVTRETRRDPILSRVLGYVMFGWPPSPKCDEEKAYFARKDEIYSELGCLLYKYRIIVPPKLRYEILREIHEGHLGMNKMKNLARNYVYWPNIDNNIEEMCRACAACRSVRDAPARAPLHPWEFPMHPWMRVHADFFDCDNKRFLVVVDAHSKWIEIIEMKGTSATLTIKALRSIFARFGLPSQLVTDNGPPFFSDEFKQYCEANVIKHTTSAPYRPQGNGEAENAVKTIKKVVKRAVFEGQDVSVALDRFLFQYRNCEHSTTGVSPAIALLGRRLRGKLDVLRPDVKAVVRQAQDKQAAAAGGRPQQLGAGDHVLVRDYTKKGDKWAEGKIKDRTGPVSFRIDMGNGKEWRRHQDQILPAGSKSRYSLSRTSTSVSDDNLVGSEGTGVEDKSLDTAADLGPEEEEKSVDEVQITSSESSDYGDANEASPPKHPSFSEPTSPAVTARTLRALRRAKNKQCGNL